MTRTLLTLAAISAVAVLTLSSCTINIGVPETSPAQETQSSESSAFDQRDLMFASMMIPHHEQALEMGVLAVAVSTDDRIQDLAQRIIDGQQPEIEVMQAWLDGAGINSSDDPHAGHDMGGGMNMMGGMATEAELEELAALSSPGFDRLFLTLMIEHHEGALDMTRMISNSQNPEAQALYREIVEVQKAEIAEMKEMLESLGNA